MILGRSRMCTGTAAFSFSTSLCFFVFFLVFSCFSWLFAASRGFIPIFVDFIAFRIFSLFSALFFTRMESNQVFVALAHVMIALRPM